jgi:hypothetical protein
MALRKTVNLLDEVCFDLFRLLYRIPANYSVATKADFGKFRNENAH